MIANKNTVVAAILLNDNRQILISSRPLGKSFAGQWEFVGGKVEANETHQEALIRELQEELTLDLQPFLATEKFFHQLSLPKLEIYFYLFKVKGEVFIEAREQQLWKWIGLADLQKHKFLKTNRVIVDKLARYLS